MNLVSGIVRSSSTRPSVPQFGWQNHLAMTQLAQELKQPNFFEITRQKSGFRLMEKGTSSKHNGNLVAVPKYDVVKEDGLHRVFTLKEDGSRHEEIGVGALAAEKADEKKRVQDALKACRRWEEPSLLRALWQSFWKVEEPECPTSVEFTSAGDIYNRMIDLQKSKD